jgi:hypothetical protein
MVAGYHWRRPRGGGDAVGVESVRDRGQALAGCPFALDPLDRVGGRLRRPAEPGRPARKLEVFETETFPAEEVKVFWKALV